MNEAVPIDSNLLPYHLNRLVSQMNRVWQSRLRAHGLTVQRWQVLSILNHLEGVRVQQLAEMSGMDQPVLTRVVDQMARDKLAERRVNPDDSRSRLVSITKKGRDLHGALLPYAEEFLVKLYGDMPAADRDQLVSLLVRLEGNLEGEPHA